MRIVSRCVDGRDVEGRKHLRILLELDHEADDVLSGRIATGEELHEFSGWLSLIAALENVRHLEGGARSPPEHI